MMKHILFQVRLPQGFSEREDNNTSRSAKLRTFGDCDIPASKAGCCKKRQEAMVNPSIDCEDITSTVIYLYLLVGPKPLLKILGNSPSHEGAVYPSRETYKGQFSLSLPLFISLTCLVKCPKIDFCCPSTSRTYSKPSLSSSPAAERDSRLS